MEQKPTKWNENNNKGPDKEATKVGNRKKTSEETNTETRVNT